jgi:tetratricopeptide (TPR) repeat protein
VRYRHLWFYLLFFLGFMCLVAVFFRFVLVGVDLWAIANPQVLQPHRMSKIVSAVSTLCMLALLIAYFRLLFGAMSRAFERQADAYALESIGRSEPLISALERISVFSGDIRDLPSWHHGSIADRVNFLEASARDPRRLREHHLRVKRLTRYFLLGILASAALTIGVYSGPIDQGLDDFVNRSRVKQRVRIVWEQMEEVQLEIEKRPGEASLWFQLASLYYAIKREVQAEKAYTEVIRLDNTHAEALNNLAWLYLTTRNPELYHPKRALGLAELAVRSKPVPHILDTLAEARFHARDVEGALEAIEAALAKNPENRAYYLAQQKKFSEAVED